MNKYNGHKNYNHWNVSLWINNDEGLYSWARELKREMGADRAARYFLEAMRDEGGKTPDGAPYSLSAIRAAMVGM